MDGHNGRRITGDDLRLMRVAARLSMRQVAKLYGVSSQRIAAIEAHTRPSVGACERYYRAVVAARDAER